MIARDLAPEAAEADLVDQIRRLWAEVDALRADLAASRAPSVLSVREFARKHPSFTPGALRALLLHRRTNGYDRAVVERGRLVLIDESAFFEVLREKQAAKRRGRGRPRSR